MIWLPLLVVALGLGIAYVLWLRTDKELYAGEAWATENRMKHYSTDTRTIFLVFGPRLPGHEILVHELPLKEAARVTLGTPVYVIVKQRKWSGPRITAFSFL